MSSGSSSVKRRKVDPTPPAKGWVSSLHFETFCITRVTSRHAIDQLSRGGEVSSRGVEVSRGSEVIKHGSRSLPVPKDCLPDYEIYDLSGSLDSSPPPCHWESFLFNELKTFDITLQLDNSEFSAHRAHLAKCCRYFQGMFSSSMVETVKPLIRLHGVDEPSFRAIISSFYSGFLSVCSECVLRLLKTGTFLQSDIIIEICHMYLLAHMDVNSVFRVLEVAVELAYSNITEHALRLICANLGPEGNLIDTDEFLDLPPSTMSLIVGSKYQTNCMESELASGLFRWAARTWEWYEMITPNHHVQSRDSHMETASKHEEQASSFLDDSGIVLSDEYVVELPSMNELFDIPSPPPLVLAGVTEGDSRDDSRESSATVAETRDSWKNTRTYSRKSHGKGKKRKREEEDEDNEPTSQIAVVRSAIEEVILQVEFSNMEPETLHNFLELYIVRKLPSVHSHIRRTAHHVWARACVERGCETLPVLCYHRCYRSLQNPLRSTILYYQYRSRWHILDHTLNVNLISGKCLILHDILYMFGMCKPPGQPATPRAYRFNQFTGYWRELPSPPCSFTSSSRIIAHGGCVLLIGGTNVGSGGFAAFQQQHVTIHQYIPHKETWKEIDIDLPITNHQLQRYVNSIISHDGLLYYVSKNKLCTFYIDDETPRQREVSLISHMFSHISNYWLYGYKDRIVLMGGLCTAQGGNSWQNREILIFNTVTSAWTVIQNEKPSPMYEMMSGTVINNQIYTVSHAASAGDHVAKVELFDLEQLKWKKGLNLKYESPVQCMEYCLTAGSMLIKPSF